jgi:CHAT domain-containing protein
MLSVGVRAVVAPVLPIPDAETAPLMRELHSGLRAGLTTSEALATAMSGVFGGADTSLAAGVSFICVGI